MRRFRLQPGRRLFLHLRTSRQTELLETCPVQVVTAWPGTTGSVAMKHDLLTFEQHLEAAVRRDVYAAQNPARDDGIVDQGRKVRPGVDTALLLPLCGQSGAAASVRTGFQRGQLPVTAGAATGCESVSLATSRGRLIKVGVTLASHARSVTFQMVEAAIPRPLFRELLRRNHRLKMKRSSSYRNEGWAR